MASNRSARGGLHRKATPNRPHFLFVSGSSSVWGAETSLLILARELVKAGFDTALLAESADFVSAWPGSVVDNRSGVTRTLLRYLLHRRPYAMVCCSLRLAPVFATLGLLPRGIRPNLVLDLHDYLPTQRGRRRVRVLARFFDCVIAVTAFTASQVGSRTKSTLVLDRPIDPDHLAGAAASSAPTTVPTLRRVGAIGRIDPDKRLEVAVAAVGLLPDVQLVVRGAFLASADYEQTLRAEAAPLGDRVVFEGRVPVQAVMSGIECLVVANPEEPMGRTVAEAQLSGVPVIVPDEGGAAELVEDGRTGRYFRAGSPQSLAEVIAEVLGDTDGTARIAATARASATARNDPRTVARRYAAFALTGRRDV
jgi:glycosyltransferase involved in cell wall biosynthesis